jgi:hypothetical protein
MPEMQLRAETIESQDTGGNGSVVVLLQRQVTLVGNDSGLFLLAAAQHPQGIAGLVVSTCEDFDNFPPAITDAWLHPLLTQPAIRRDLTKYLRDSAKDPGVLVAASCPRARAAAGWAAPHGQLLEVPDSYTLIPEDQPAELARAVSQFVRHTDLHR